MSATAKILRESSLLRRSLCVLAGTASTTLYSARQSGRNRSAD